MPIHISGFRVVVGKKSVTLTTLQPIPPPQCSGQKSVTLTTLPSMPPPQCSGQKSVILTTLQPMPPPQIYLYRQHLAVKFSTSDCILKCFLIANNYFRLMETEETCPMCSEKVLKENLEKITDPAKYLNPEEGTE